MTLVTITATMMMMIITIRRRRRRRRRRRIGNSEVEKCLYRFRISKQQV
jgi:hypothetical protein